MSQPDSINDCGSLIGKTNKEASRVMELLPYISSTQITIIFSAEVQCVRICETNFKPYHQGFCDGNWAQAGFNGMTNMLTKKKKNTTTFLNGWMHNRLLPYYEQFHDVAKRPIIKTVNLNRDGMWTLWIEINRTAQKARIV